MLLGFWNSMINKQWDSACYNDICHVRVFLRIFVCCENIAIVNDSVNPIRLFILFKILLTECVFWIVSELFKSFHDANRYWSFIGHIEDVRIDAVALNICD